ncbi:FAD-dependent thymidylate synthase [Campylobacter lanienae]|uniref:FAD-dependent thymidylate synthase n=1 Tax=Campylobacter lanienae TaxID=75658 RepID=UPI00242B10F7|nr:FAD-dependent thymidylate synthase [Campylobacter lanienae]MDD7514464.1 FAD-dependent thymidylate synthase [Campylobacter lanienae]MDY5518843.1 FAD-dependent thymidylate synthase [Campylobacter lanienae]
MDVKLLNYTPLWICSNAIRTCWQSFDKGDNGGEIDLALIDRVGNKLKHASTLEHLFYNFYIKGISRACLQELARHRIASLSVKSTRYTLKELKNESEFKPNDFNNASRYIVLTSNEFVDNASINALENLRQILNQNTSLDIAKYCLPESYKTELSWSINARSLQNFLSLRSSKSALWEIRDLANLIYQNLPQEHKFIYQDFISA